MDPFQQINTENWMKNLPEAVRKLSVIYLAIPGSHNSMTYAINKHSKISPDADNTVRKVNHIFPRIVRRWCKTQSANITQQLFLGARFFDLRVCTKNKNQFYFAHGCYSCEVFQALMQINEFLNSHQNEFVILDFQHFYGLTIEDHHNFQKKVQEIFGNKLYGRMNGTLMECNLEYANEYKKQIIIIYRDCHLVPQIFWEDYYWPTPWPNTCNINQLKTFLEKRLLNRSPYTGYVSQCVITPSSRYIIARFFLSLKFCANRVNKKLKNWIKSQRCGMFIVGDAPRCNVFLGDYININDGDFCKNIIALNYEIM